MGAFSKLIPEYKLEIIAGSGGELTAEDLARARAVHALIRKGIAETADVCQLSPRVCSQNLGVRRSDMPQIPEESVRGLLSSRDPLDRAKGEAAVEAGADPEDDQPRVEAFIRFLRGRGIKVEEKGPSVEVGKLRATQKEIKAGKTFSIAEEYFKGAYDPTDAPLIVSEDNYILDGHHRWSAMLTADPSVEMKVRRIMAPMRRILELAFEMPGVYRMDLQDRVVDPDAPLDLARDPGSVWKQTNGKWYVKDSDGKTSGPYASEEAAKGHLKGGKGKSAARVAARFLRDEF